MTVSPTPNPFKGLIGKRESKKFKIMGQELLINKLTVAEVRLIRAKAQEPEKGDDELSLGVLLQVIRLSVPDAAELSDEDFESFPMDELQKLSAAILEFSGFGDAKK